MAHPSLQHWCPENHTSCQYFTDIALNILLTEQRHFDQSCLAFIYSYIGNFFVLSDIVISMEALENPVTLVVQTLQMSQGVLMLKKFKILSPFTAGEDLMFFC